MQDSLPLGAAAELSNALFQAGITAGLAVFALVLHRRLREDWLLWWAAAWGLYALRLGAMSTFLITWNTVWFFWFLVATGWAALAILWSALRFAGYTQRHPWFLLLALFPPVWGGLTSRYLDEFTAMAVPTVLFLSGATLWAGWVFWQRATLTRSGGARFVAIALFLWGIHQLDYLILRPQGTGRTWSYYLDITFELAVGIGFGLMALADFASRLELRTAELGRLSALMVRQHEAERRRLSHDLHDETAQTLSAVKLEVGMLREGAAPATQERLDHVLALVDGGIRGIRRVMNDLRPALLDDIGLSPAIHSLASDVRDRGHLAVHTDLPDTTPRLPAELELALFRAAQEALANVIRHAEATQVHIALAQVGERLQLTIRDNGRGMTPSRPEEAAAAGHLGLAGMRERIGTMGGRVTLTTVSPGGVTVTVDVPIIRDTPGPARPPSRSLLTSEEKT